jgi:16S rRNA pseudouridine516 synthase
VRIDRFLSNSKVGSRSYVRELIRGGKITVNGSVVRDPSYKVGEKDEVYLASTRIGPHRDVYLVLNKPSGYVSSNGERDSVVNIIDHPYKDELHCAGRLDKDVRGLLIVTNDGNFIHEIISPRKHVEKEYVVTIEGILTDEMIMKISCGVELPSGYRTKPAVIKDLGNNSISLTICEGKYHQVKDMITAIGLKWTDVRRVRIGRLVLPDIPEGKWVELPGEYVCSMIFSQQSFLE